MFVSKTAHCYDCACIYMYQAKEDILESRTIRKQQESVARKEEVLLLIFESAFIVYIKFYIYMTLYFLIRYTKL